MPTGTNWLPFPSRVIQVSSIMVKIGRFNTLRVVHEAGPGFFLDGGELGEILLPGRFRTLEIEAEQLADVFVYRDSEDRLIATTQTPLAQVDEFAFLRVVSINERVGAFLDWGLDKDLLLPKREWPGSLQMGDHVVVRVRVDERTNRIVASARIDYYLDNTPACYQRGQEVRLLIAAETTLGYKAIINDEHSGLIYHSDVNEPLVVGQALPGYILRVRPDEKIDLTIHQSGYKRIAPLTEEILEMLRDRAGFLPYHDKSPPAGIQATFGVSKKAFKQAIGALFKERRITIEPDGIRLVKPAGKP